MEKFNQRFEQEMKQQRPVSDLTRKTLDAVYLEIAPSNSQKLRKSKSSNKLLAVIAILIAGSISLVSFTPLNDAVSKWLSFDWLTSKTLTEGNFVSNQTAVATDQATTIKLREVFADQTQVGLHFTIQLPTDSSLLANDIREHILNFALYNGDGTLLADANSDLNKDRQDSVITGPYSFKSQVDRDANTIDLTVILHGGINEKIPELKNASVKVTRISAIKEESNSKGFSQQKDNSIKGTWSLPIDSKMIRTFPILNFKNITETPGISVVSAYAHSSSFALTLEYTETLQDILKKGDPSAITLTGNNDKRSYSYKLSQIETQEQQDKKVKIFIFEYGGYDDFDTVSIHLSSTETLTLEKR